MKMTAGQGAWNAALSKMQGVVSERTQLPSLRCVRIAADGGGNGVRLTATNIDITVDVHLDCAVEGSLAEPLVVPYRQFAGVVAAAQPGDIELDASKKGRIAVKTATGRFSIPTLEAGSFPPDAQNKDEARVAVAGEALRAALRQVRFAVAKPSESRDTLKNTLLSIDGDALTCVGTNGRALARVSCGLAKGADGNVELVVPSASCAELLRLASDDGDVEVAYSVADGYAEFSMKGCSLRTRLHNGKYPNWSAVVPHLGSGEEVEMDASAFTSAVRRVSLFLSGDSTRYVGLDAKDGAMEISAPDGDLGAAKETVALDGRSRQAAFKVNLSPELINDAVTSAETDAVKLHYLGEASPVVVCGVGGKGGRDYLAVVMPMRV